MSVKEESRCEDESGDIYDSQDSDTERFVIRHELVQSVAEYCSEEGDTDDDREANQLFGQNSTLRSKLWEPKIEIDKSSVIKREDVVQVKQYDLGHHFDPMITKSLDKISSVTKQVEDSPKGVKTRTKNGGIEDIQLSFKRRGVSPQYSDLITNETVSKRFIDWHFITEDSQFQELPIETTLYDEQEALVTRYPTLESLLMSFGVSGDMLDSLATEKYLLTSKRGIDTLCQLSPIDSILDAFSHYINVSEQFTKYFICLILDRKVYESLSCDSLWCTKIFKNLPHHSFLDEYFSLVHPHDYFLHHRVIKLIANIQTPLIRRIFFKDNDQSDEEARKVLVAEFNHLFDKRRLQDLLYFVLSIYGSEFMPFGDTLATRYFKNCVDDLFNASASDVEISLISGILGVILKIPS